MAIPAYSSNMSLINPNDLNVMNRMGGSYGNGFPSWGDLGMNTQAMQGAQMMPNQTPQMTASEGMSQMDMYRMAAGALQGMAKNQQPQQMPQLPILRDSNQFRFAGMQQNPQMLAQALRNRG